MKRTFIIMAVLLSLILTFEKVSAYPGSLEGVHSEAVINNDGTVNIKQTWYYNDENVYNGTEHYINMRSSYGYEDVAKGKEAITDYKVSRNGQEMVYEDNWKANETFEDKSDKYGVLELGSQEIELVFGVSERTYNEFVVEYKVHNVIKETSDGYKYLHWTFLPTELSPTPGFLTSEIYVQEDVEIDKVYGFSYIGEVGFIGNQRNGVYAQMNGSYDQNTTLNIFTLLTDKQNLIKNTQKVKMTLNEKAKQILKGSDYDLDHFYSKHHGTILASEDPWWKTFYKTPLFQSLSPLFVIISFYVFILWMSKSHSRSLIKEMYKEEVRKLKKDKQHYYRDKPDNIIHFTEVMRQLKMVENVEVNIISYFISKWTSEGVFEYISHEEEKLFFMSSVTITFKLIREKLKVESKLEENVFEEFYKLADENQIVTNRDLVKLNMRAISKHMYSHSSEHSYDRLEEMGYVFYEGKKSIPLSKKEGGAVFLLPGKPVLTSKGQDVLFQHVGLRNYLEQFTLMKERSVQDIELWDYYFYMAALYGITDKFQTEIKNIPNLSKEGRNRYNMYYGNSSSALLYSNVSNRVSNSYRSHKSSRSSSGGGRGSSGGGRGGGTR